MKEFLLDYELDLQLGEAMSKKLEEQGRRKSVTAVCEYLSRQRPTEFTRSPWKKLSCPALRASVRKLFINATEMSSAQPKSRIEPHEGIEPDLIALFHMKW